MSFEISGSPEGCCEGVAEHERCRPRAMGELRSLWGVISSHRYRCVVELFRVQLGPYPFPRGITHQSHCTITPQSTHLALAERSPSARRRPLSLFVRMLCGDLSCHSLPSHISTIPFSERPVSFSFATSSMSPRAALLDNLSLFERHLKDSYRDRWLD